jgi:hypothetical protein
MKTGKLFEFTIEDLSDALREAFADEATKDFDAKDETQCTGCLHTTDRLFAVAETQRHALRAINSRKMGLCGTCIAGLIATQGWNIVAPGDRF